MDVADVRLFESSDDEDEQERVRRPKQFRNRNNYFEELEEVDFFTRFRLKKNAFQNLLADIQHDIRSTTDRNNALTPTTKLLLTLRFYATGSMLIVAGDLLGVSKSSACVTVRIVTEAIARLSNRYIKFPTTAEEKKSQKIRFYNIARFPSVLGCIDCTHVRIQSPGGDDAEEYRNRKGYFSWNIQIIVDDKLRIQDIIARWPGRSHDQTIFDNSRIKARCENGEFGIAVLLGDSGYGITNYLMTPLLNPNTPAERLYNESHIRSRNVVERTFGVWKRRFPILSSGMKVSPERSRAIIVATAILHNIAVNEGKDVPLADDVIQMEEGGEEVNN